jgi:uncharacterized protein
MKKLIVVASLLFSATAYAASFDCQQARTPVENAICTYPEIGSLDEQLASAYHSAINSSPDADRIKSEQRNWITQVRNKCEDTNCLISAYQSRISAIADAVTPLESISQPPIEESEKTVESQELNSLQQEASSTSESLKENSTPTSPQQTVTEQVTVEPASESKKLGSDMVTVMWFAVAAIGIGLLIAGASNKVVIYYNGAEMAISLLAVVLPFVALLMFDSAPFESETFNWMFRWVASPITGIIGILCLIMNFQQAIKHNKNVFVGVFVGAFKIVFVSLTVLAVLGQIGKLTNKDTSFRDAIWAVILLAIFVSVAKAMINGPEVYRAKGWQLPELEPSAA